VDIPRQRWALPISSSGSRFPELGTNIAKFGVFGKLGLNSATGSPAPGPYTVVVSNVLGWATSAPVWLNISTQLVFRALSNAPIGEMSEPESDHLGNVFMGYGNTGIARYDGTNWVRWNAPFRF